MTWATSCMPHTHMQSSRRSSLETFFNNDNPKEEKLGDAIELTLRLFELWDSVPSCILQSQKLVNEMRRGIECSLIDFFSMEGANLSSTNRKITKRKKIDEEVPTNIEGVPSELNYFIPDDEGEEDFSPFTELLEEAEEEEQSGDEEEDEDMEEEGAETIYSSGEGTERAQDEQEETENKDDPMEGSPKEEPDTKRRKLAEMIEAIPITAEAHGACLACGLAGHSMSECKNTEDREKI